jgi:uncharacterized membrane protein
MGKTKRLGVVMMSVLVIALFVAVFLVVTPAKPVAANPGTPVTQNITPTHDAEICQASPNAPDNIDKRYNLYVGWSPTYQSQRAYFTFDLTTKIPSSVVISSAVLKLNSLYGPSLGDANFTPTTHWVDAYGVDNDDWGVGDRENNFTWNIAQASAPLVGLPLDNENFQADDYVGPYFWYSWDVTSFVKDQMAGDKIVSLGLKGRNEGVYNSCGWFHSKDALNTGQSEYWPCLQLTYTVDVTVGISPSTQSGTPGNPLTYSVTVTNYTGYNNAKFDLTVENQWVTSLSSNVVGPLAQGGSSTVTLTVNCPTARGFDDTITVTATYQDNHLIYSSGTCTASTLPFYATDDTYGIEQHPSYIMGNADGVYIGTMMDGASVETWTAENCRGYWKFNISGIPSNATIDNAYFQVCTRFGGENGGWLPAGGGKWKWEGNGGKTLTVNLKKVANDAWSEGTMTWDNMQTIYPMGSSICSMDVCASGWYSFNVKDFAIEQFAGDKIVSLGMISENQGKNLVVPWTSKDDTVNGPTQKAKLSVWYTLPVATHPSVVVTSPISKNGTAGNPVTYQVTVTNTGDAFNTFNLSVNDTSGWNPTISPISLPLATMAFGTADVSVTIPSSAAGGAFDNVTVTATGTGASATGSCLVIVGGTISPFDVSISPGSQSGLSENTIVTYTVTVTNKGNSQDRYNLAKSFSGGSAWPASLSKASVGPINPEASGTSTLIVTIPTGTPLNANRTVTVTATSQANSSATNDASCLVVALGPKRLGVWVGISPSPQENIPGGTLRYFVTVTNMGNAEDDYTLSVTDTRGWGLTLPSSIADVARNEDRTVTLTVVILDNAADNDSSTITVTATSDDNTAVDYSATCTAGCAMVGVTSLTISPSAFALFPGYSGQVQALTATLIADGNPLSHKTITWLATAGIVSPSSGTTDSLGKVYVTYTASTITDETAPVTIAASFAGDDTYHASSGTSQGISATTENKVIGPEGGTFVVTINGTAVNLLEVPQNAISESKNFTLSQAPRESVSGYKMASHIFNIGPSGTIFDNQSTLTLPYDESEIPLGVSEDNLTIYCRTSGGGWERVGGTVDTTANTVSVQIDHLSEYAVMASTGEVVDGGGLPLLMIGVVVAVILIVAVIAVFIIRRR